MLSQDLESCAVSIGVLGGKVGEEEWAYLRMLRANLMATLSRRGAWSWGCPWPAPLLVWPSLRRQRRIPPPTRGGAVGWSRSLALSRAAAKTTRPSRQEVQR